MSEPVERRRLSAEIQTTVERRKSPRTPFVVSVRYSSVDVLFSEFARNINEGGLFIQTENPAPIDTLVRLEFQLPGSVQPIQTEGRVVWTREGEDGEAPGMGVEFEGLSDAARAEINRLVRSLRADRR